MKFQKGALINGAVVVQQLIYRKTHFPSQVSRNGQECVLLAAKHFSWKEPSACRIHFLWWFCKARVCQIPRLSTWGVYFHNLLIKFLSRASNWIFIRQQGNFPHTNGLTAVWQRHRELCVPTTSSFNACVLTMWGRSQVQWQEEFCSSVGLRDGSYLRTEYSVLIWMNGNDFLTSV